MVVRRLRKQFSVKGGGLRRLIAMSVAVVMVLGAGASVAFAGSARGRWVALTNRDTAYYMSAGSSAGSFGIFRVAWARPYGRDEIRVKLVCERTLRCHLTDSVRMHVVKYGKRFRSLRATGLDATGRHVTTLIVGRGRLTLRAGQTRTVIVALDQAGRRLALAGKRVTVRLVVAAGNDTLAGGRTSFVLGLTE